MVGVIVDAWVMVVVASMVGVIVGMVVVVVATMVVVGHVLVLIRHCCWWAMVVVVSHVTEGWGQNSPSR